MPLRKTPYFCRSGWKCKNGWTDTGVSDTTCPVGHQCYTFTYSQHERILGGLGNVRKGCTDLAFENSPDHVVSKPKTEMVNECRSIVQTITSGQFAGRSHKYTACTCTGNYCNKNGKLAFCKAKVFSVAFLKKLFQFADLKCKVGTAAKGKVLQEAVCIKGHHKCTSHIYKQPRGKLKKLDQNSLRKSSCAICM